MRFAPMFVLLLCVGCSRHKSADAGQTTEATGSTHAAVKSESAAALSDLAVPGVEGLRVTVTMPAGPGPFPLVLFSPNLGRSGNAYAFYAKAWSARGYACARVSHPGSDIRIFAGKPFWKVGDTAERVAKDPDEWQARVRDLRAVLDAWPDLAASHADLARVDAGRVAVAGHSFGAFTALALAGLRVDLPNHPAADLGDPRLLAVIAMAAPGPGRPLADSGFATITRPVLIIAGGDDDQEDLRGTKHPPSWREEPWSAMPAGDKWLLSIPDANHFTFSDGGGGHHAADPRQLRRVESACADFLDAYLGKDATAQERLRAAGAQGR